MHLFVNLECGLFELVEPSLHDCERLAVSLGTLLVRVLGCAATWRVRVCELC